MSFEVDIRAVGENTNSGDAIAIRYGAFSADPALQRVVIIDGGYRENGDDLVKLITNQYGTNRVDLVLCTHAHDDHVKGLLPIFEKLQVGALWMHQPWDHADSVRAFVRDRRITTQKFSERLQRSLESAYELEQVAIKQGIVPEEPFTGTSFDSRFFVIGPSVSYYNTLVCEFGEAVSPAAKFLESFEAVPRTVSALRRAISETVAGPEELVEPAIGDVDARNNSSAIVVAKLDDQVFLFTADAGVPALTQAADYAASRQYDLGANVTRVQVPHHGSKRNVSPTILDRIIGPRGQSSQKQCFVSAAKEWDTKHPSMRVTNALNRRGSKVYGTCGKNLCFHSSDVAPRVNWQSAKEIPFTPDYEEED
jgi:beta-lactamase superfamily II metal-dependent hydrolase